MSDEEKLPHLNQYGLAILLLLLRPIVGDKNRNRSSIAVARNLAEARYTRVERGEKQRNRLDELIEDMALS